MKHCPTYRIKSVFDITTDFLKDENIKTLIFDADTVDATVSKLTLERPNGNILWVIDLKVKSPVESIKLSFKFI